VVGEYQLCSSIRHIGNVQTAESLSSESSPITHAGALALGQGVSIEEVDE